MHVSVSAAQNGQLVSCIAERTTPIMLCPWINGWSIVQCMTCLNQQAASPFSLLVPEELIGLQLGLLMKQVQAGCP